MMHLGVPHWGMRDTMSAVSSRNRWFWTQLLIRPLGLGNLRDRRAVLPHESHDFLQPILFCAKAFDAGIVRVVRAVLHCETLFGTQTTLGPEIDRVLNVLVPFYRRKYIEMDANRTPSA